MPSAERGGILYVGLEYTTHDRRFLRALTSAGWPVTLARLAPRAAGVPLLDLPAGVAQVDFPGAPTGTGSPTSHLDAHVSFVRDLAHRIQPALVHAGPVQQCAYPAAIAVDGVPLSVVSWGSDLLRDARRDQGAREHARIALSKADLFVCDCLAVRDEARSIARVPDERVVLLPWGTDVEHFRPDGPAATIRELPGWSDATIVLHTRSFEAGYAVDLVLDAFARAWRANGALRLVLAGDGSQRASLEDQVERLGLRDVVRLIGRTDNESLPGWFRAADIYVSASESDGSSVSLLEALATGLPCVVTDIASNAEWVTPGVNGWLATLGDSASFARALLLAAALPSSDRARMKSANRAVATERADWTRNVTRLLSAYAAIGGER